MSAIERFATSFAAQECRQETYRGADEVQQVLNENPRRRALVIRHAGGPSGGGDVHIRYEGTQDFTAEECPHKLVPGSVLTFTPSAPTGTPRQQIQVLFPSARTVITVAEWSVRATGILDIASRLGLR
jgi:hypothetical protein